MFKIRIPSVPAGIFIAVLGGGVATTMVVEGRSVRAPLYEARIAQTRHALETATRGDLIMMTDGTILRIDRTSKTEVATTTGGLARLVIQFADTQQLLAVQRVVKRGDDGYRAIAVAYVQQ